MPNSYYMLLYITVVNFSVFYLYKKPYSYLYNIAIGCILNNAVVGFIPNKER